MDGSRCLDAPLPLLQEYVDISGTRMTCCTSQEQADNASFPKLPSFLQFSKRYQQVCSPLSWVVGTTYCHGMCVRAKHAAIPPMSPFAPFAPCCGSQEGAESNKSTALGLAPRLAPQHYVAASKVAQLTFAAQLHAWHRCSAVRPQHHARQHPHHA